MRCRFTWEPGSAQNQNWGRLIDADVNAHFHHWHQAVPPTMQHLGAHLAWEPGPGLVWPLGAAGPRSSPQSWPRPREPCQGRVAVQPRHHRPQHGCNIRLSLCRRVTGRSKKLRRSGDDIKLPTQYTTIYGFRIAAIFVKENEPWEPTQKPGRTGKFQG